jgi:hypothetical protein
MQLHYTLRCLNRVLACFNLRRPQFSNTVASVMSKMWQNKRHLFSSITERSNRNSEQEINIKFCLKLGNSASRTRTKNSVAQKL